MTKWLIVACFLSGQIQAQVADGLFKPIVNPVLRLPAGVPRTVDTNGNVVAIDFMFTTPEYQREAFKLVVQEANRVVVDLGLAESRPIREPDVVHAFICPFAYAYTERAIGNITTTNYWYVIKRGYKFGEATVANLDARCREYAAKWQLPVKQYDPNAAYQLATQWLAAAHMDVAGLNRDYDARVAVDGYWNGVTTGELPKDKFTPI